MESVSNQNTNGNSDGLNSNPEFTLVELTLLGIDKKWVRSEGGWIDKSKLPQKSRTRARDLNALEIEEESHSHWWQFWKA